MTKTASTWAPKGQPPILRRVSKRRVLSTAVALTTNGRLLKCHFDHAVKGPDVIVALRHFRRYLHGPLIIIWDRLTAHKDGEVQKWVADDADLYVEWLPSYAPDLNPEEGCNANIKARLRNATPENEEQLRQLVDRAFDQLRKRPDIIQSFFKHAGLGEMTLYT